jgi:hypothetical protein
MFEYPDEVFVTAHLDDALRGDMRACLREHGYDVVATRIATERAPLQTGEMAVRSVINPTTRELATTITLAVGAPGQPRFFTPPALTVGLARWLSGTRCTPAVAMTTATIAVFGGGLALAAWRGNAPRVAGLLTSTDLDERAIDEWELSGCFREFARTMAGVAADDVKAFTEIWHVVPLSEGSIRSLEEHLTAGAGSTVILRPATRAGSRVFPPELAFPGFRWCTEASALWPGVRWSGSGPPLSTAQDAVLARFATTGGDGRVVTVAPGSGLPKGTWLARGRSEESSLRDLEEVVTAFATALEGPGQYADYRRSLANADNRHVGSDGIACAPSALRAETEVPPAIEARFAVLEAMFARRSVASEPACIEHLLAELVPFTDDGLSPDPYLVGRAIAWCIQEQGHTLAEGTVNALEQVCVDALHGGDELLEDHARLAEHLREALRGNPDSGSH